MEHTRTAAGSVATGRKRGHFSLAAAALLLLQGILPCRAQPVDSSRIKPMRLALTCGTLGALFTGAHLYQKKAWWQSGHEPFRFQNDWQYADNVDKLGHAFAAYTEARLARHVLEWCGLSEEKSDFYAPLSAFLYQTYVEIEDGFNRTYGFSPGDEIANLAGATLACAQTAYPPMRSISLKFSYYPSKIYLDALQHNGSRVFIDDYDGTIFWIAVDPHGLLPAQYTGPLPEWLGIAFGSAIHHLDTLRIERSYYLTLDYQLTKSPTESAFLRALLGTLDMFHLPAPGIAVEGGKLKAGIYYTYNVKLAL